LGQFTQSIQPRTLVPLHVVVLADVSSLFSTSWPAAILSDWAAPNLLDTSTEASIPNGSFHRLNSVVAPPFPQPPLDLVVPSPTRMDANFNPADLPDQNLYDFTYLELQSQDSRRAR
jgi:hypothetical protein